MSMSGPTFTFRILSEIIFKKKEKSCLSQKGENEYVLKILFNTLIREGAGQMS